MPQPNTEPNQRQFWETGTAFSAWEGHGNEAKSISLSWRCVFLCDLREYAK